MPDDIKPDELPEQEVPQENSGQEDGASAVATDETPADAAETGDQSSVEDDAPADAEMPDSDMDAAKENEGEPDLTAVEEEPNEGAFEEEQESGDGNDFPDLSDVKVEETMASQVEFQQLDPSTPGPSSGGNIELLLDVKMPVSIELGRTELPISDILSLGPGSVVELDKLAGEPVDLLVNDKIMAKGEVVVVDENFGVRITMLMSPEERLKSLN